jgi:hypothetical protein
MSIVAIASDEDDSASIAPAAEGAEEDGDEVVDISLPCGFEKGIHTYHMPYMQQVRRVNISGSLARRKPRRKGTRRRDKLFSMEKSIHSHRTKFETETLAIETHLTVCVGDGTSARLDCRSSLIAPATDII